MKNSICLAMALAPVASGCAKTPTPSTSYSHIDPAGVNMAQYQRDYADCAALANQTDTGKNAVGGAVGGAIIGALISGIMGGSKYQSNYVARAGAVAGTGGAIAQAEQEKKDVMRRCLGGRGYRVIR